MTLDLNSQKEKLKLLPQNYLKNILRSLSFFLLGMLIPTVSYAFSVLVEDLDKRKMLVEYQAFQSQTLDSDYLHQLLLEKFQKMSQIYQKIDLTAQEASDKSKLDYLLEVHLYQQNDGRWAVDYHCRSPWLDHEHASLLNLSYQNLSERYVLYTARVVFDQLICSLFHQSGIFEKPLAFVKQQSQNYEIILSDLLFEKEKTLYSTLNPISQLLWQEKTSRLFWTEITPQGTELKSLHIGEKNSLKNYLKSSLISSLTYSAADKSLYFITDLNHIPHIYRLNLAHHQLKQLTSGPLWIASLNQILDKNHLLISSNRSGSLQLYDLDLSKNFFKRLSFEKFHQPCGVQLKSKQVLQIVEGDNPTLKNVYHKQKTPIYFDTEISSFDVITPWPQNQAAFVQVSDLKRKTLNYVIFDGSTQAFPLASKKEIKNLAMSSEDLLNKIFP